MKQLDPVAALDLLDLVCRGGLADPQLARAGRKLPSVATAWNARACEGVI